MPLCATCRRVRSSETPEYWERPETRENTESTYDWEIGRGRTPGGPIRSIFLIGVPRSATAARE